MRQSMLLLVVRTEVAHRRNKKKVEIKVCTHINRCKPYPYASKRQQNRWAGK